MDIHIAETTHKRLQRQLYAAWGISGCLLVSNVLLACLIGFAWSHEKIIVTPPVITTSFSMSAEQPDANYLEMMALFWINLRLNVTPATIDSQQHLLLHYTDASFYGPFSQALKKEQALVKKEQISSLFYPELQRMQIDSAQHRVTIPGVLKRWMGDVALPEQQKAYVLHYAFRHGQLSVDNFYLVGANHEKK